MSEKYTFQGNNSFTEIFIAHASIGHEEVFDKENWTPGEPLDISLRLNGVEVPFLKTMEYVFSFYEQELNAKAADLVTEKIQFRKLFDLIQDYEWKIKEELKKIFNLEERIHE